MAMVRYSGLMALFILFVVGFMLPPIAGLELAPFIASYWLLYLLGFGFVLLLFKRGKRYV